MEATTAAAISAGSSVLQGVGGYKSGQASSRSAQATALYNRQISEINAQMEASRGLAVRSIVEANAEQIAEQAVYNAFIIDRQAEEIELQNDFDIFIASRQYDIFTSEKRARWGTAGVTMAGSPTTVAIADANAASLNLANIQQRGIQAASQVRQNANMTLYKGKVDFNNLMQQAFMEQYTSDIRRANIINEGSMNYYAGQTQAYAAQQQANSALISGIAGGISGGLRTYASLGGFNTPPVTPPVTPAASLISDFGPSFSGFTSAAQNQSIFGQTPMQPFGPLPG